MVLITIYAYHAKINVVDESKIVEVASLLFVVKTDPSMETTDIVGLQFSHEHVLKSTNRKKTSNIFFREMEE